MGAAPADKAGGNLRARLSRATCVTPPGGAERRRYAPRPLAPVPPSGDPPLRRTTRTRTWGPHPHACHSPARRFSYIATDGSTRRSAAALTRRRMTTRPNLSISEVGAAPRAAPENDAGRPGRRQSLHGRAPLPGALRLATVRRRTSPLFTAAARSCCAIRRSAAPACDSHTCVGPPSPRLPLACATDLVRRNGWLHTSLRGCADTATPTRPTRR